MKITKYIYWQDNAMWLGYFEEYPDYMTQGKTLVNYLTAYSNCILHIIKNRANLLYGYIFSGIGIPII